MKNGCSGLNIYLMVRGNSAKTTTMPNHGYSEYLFPPTNVDLFLFASLAFANATLLFFGVASTLLALFILLGPPVTCASCFLDKGFFTFLIYVGIWI